MRVERNSGTAATAAVTLALLVGALVGCGGGTSTTAEPRSSSTRGAGRTTTSVATTTSTVAPTTTTAALPNGYPSGSSVVAADCPAVVALPHVENPSVQDPPVTQTIVVHEYSVQGPSIDDVRSQLDTCGPHDETGARHDAYTKWYVSWAFGFDRSNGCRADPVKVQLLVDMYVPRLDADASAPAASPWAAYRPALLAHESGHVQNGIDAANQVETAISSLAPAATCDEAQDLANQAAQQVTDSFAQRDVTYDADTDHGRTQGAVFP